MNLIQTKSLCASSSNLADMLTMVNPIDFGGHSSKVKVTMVIIDKCGVRGDAMLCIVIFYNRFTTFLHRSGDVFPSFFRKLLSCLTNHDYITVNKHIYLVSNN